MGIKYATQQLNQNKRYPSPPKCYCTLGGEFRLN
jgi:hypothetical protein